MSEAKKSFEKLKNQLFISVIALETDLNSGLTLQELTTGLTVGDAGQSPKGIGFIVLNHTEEPIVFSDIGFGLKVFQFDLSSKTWNQASLMRQPDPHQRVLPPHLEAYDFTVDNLWSIFGDELEKIGYPQLRLYVSGIGSRTGKDYGAYIDVMIKL